MPKRNGLQLHLLHDFCPCCFKPKIGSFSVIDKSDPRVDNVQYYHAVENRNGLRILDLARPGEACECSAACNMTCMVCSEI